MAIGTYSELVTAVQNWLMDRTDIAAYVPDFITLAEDYLNYGMGDEAPPLRVRDMETIATITSTAGVAALPSDYLQYRRLVTSSGLRYPILYTSPDGADELYPSGEAGLAKHFTIVGTNLYTYPKVTADLELTYYAKIPALTASAATNWLLTKSPSIYLRATLMQAAEFIKNDAEAQKQAVLCRSFMQGLSNSDQIANYARAGVTLRGNTP